MDPRAREEAVAARDSDDDNQDPRITAKLAEILAQAPVLFDRLTATSRAGARAGSEAAQDESSPLGHHVRIMAIDHLTTGIEHLVIWHRLLTAGVQPYAAHVTLVRGAMEGAITCRWLIDPREDSAERIRRGVALLLEDYGNRGDFERDFGLADSIKPPAKSAAVRRAELKAERIAAKIGPTQAPKMTTLFGAYIGLPPARGRAVYRLLSAWAHGKQWKGMTAKFEVVEGAVAVPGGKFVRATANDDLSLNLTTLGMMTATRALNELDAYCGVDRPRLLAEGRRRESPALDLRARLPRRAWSRHAGTGDAVLHGVGAAAVNDPDRRAARPRPGGRAGAGVVDAGRGVRGDAGGGVSVV